MERSLANALTPGYGLGVAAAVHRGRWAATAGWFSDPIKNDDGSQRKRGAGLVARLTYAPVVNSNDVVNLGAALEHRTLDAGQPFRAQTGPEAAFVPTLIHTRGMARSTDFTNLGLEAAWAHKSFLLQGQVMEAQVARAGAADVTLRGGYVQGSWIVTGQRYRYSSASGVIGDVALPAGKQALELAVRYSVLDLNSRDARGGIARDLTLGANWYMNRNIRVMANYIRAKAQDLPVGADRTSDVFALRLQAAF